MLFIDTSAFLALANDRDTYYKAARRLLMDLQKGRLRPSRLITSDYIIDETLTRIRFKAGHTQAVSWSRNIHSSNIIELMRVDKTLYEDALAIFEKYHDKQLSFTDCTSFALMKSMGIDDVFTFDEDFRKMGFNSIP
ncbi:MAG: PIN domain-containing protein [Methanosarcinales archaeon]|nr:PIN domain-containing protein [ANME-2 cluster archaeon]MDW7775346.1 PIN domain-containing protein [Methanosarcinales archaeon]